MELATVQDIREVELIIGHSTVYHDSSDDGGGDPVHAFDVAFWWLTTPGNVVFLGHGAVVMFQPRNFITYEMHLGFIQGARREITRQACEAGKWLFGNTSCKKVVAMIPEYRRSLIRYARMCGMKQEGISRQSFQKGEKLFDCILLGATKEELTIKYGGAICRQP